MIEGVESEIQDRQIGRWECTALPSMDPKQAALDYALKNNVDMVMAYMYVH